MSVIKIQDLWLKKIVSFFRPSHLCHKKKMQENYCECKYFVDKSSGFFIDLARLTALFLVIVLVLGCSAAAAVFSLHCMPSCIAQQEMPWDSCAGNEIALHGGKFLSTIRSKQSSKLQAFLQPLQTRKSYNHFKLFSKNVHLLQCSCNIIWLP